MKTAGVRPTQFPEIGYTKVTDDLWRFVDTSTGAAVGPHFKTKAELLANLTEFASTFGAAGAASSAPRGWTLTYHVHAADEDLPLEGHFVEAGGPENAEVNAALERELLGRLDRGDLWAWCTVTVVAKLEHASGFTFLGEATLGACSYENEEQFRADGYFDDMKKEALANLRARLEEAADKGRVAVHVLEDLKEKA